MRLEVGLGRWVDLLMLNAVDLDKAYKMSLSGKISARGIASLTIAVAGSHPEPVEVELAVILAFNRESAYDHALVFSVKLDDRFAATLSACEARVLLTILDDSEI